MTWFVIDIEADGPAPGIDMYSMISFGVVPLIPGLPHKFYGQCSPISPNFLPEALAVSKTSREETLKYNDPSKEIPLLVDFVNKTNVGGRPIFVSDNLAFDWTFMNYYLHKYTGSNIFGHSGRCIGDIYAGIMHNMGERGKWKKYRKTLHTHNPVDDAKGNAEALLEIMQGIRGRPF